MAMEKQFVITDTHPRTITAIGFHPIRREIVVGFEAFACALDGVIKWWEQDTGKLMLTSSDHTGLITDFQYWADHKLLLSAGNDGLIMVWGSGGNCMDKIRIGHPVYAMSLSLRKQQIICGLHGGLHLYTLDPLKTSGNVIDSRKSYQVMHHYDIVPCVISHESRVYSAGYDGRFCIYDTTLYPGKVGLDLTHVVSRAHEAGINCMILVKDNENNTWIITGSFDRSVKIWSQDGQLRNRLETIFMHTITSLCYIPRAKVVWIASASHKATLYDPKAGENVTEFLPIFQSDGDDENIHKLLKLRHNAESGQVVGTTNRRHIIVWKYNSQGCMTALKCQEAVETISYTRKVPLLLFSAGNAGNVYKWERLQSSYFMYSMEKLSRKEARDKLEAIKKERGIGEKPSVISAMTSQSLASRSRILQQASSVYAAYNQALVTPSFLYKKTSSAILRSLYVESLDLLVLAAEDGNIYVWGFDLAAVTALQKLSSAKETCHIDQKYNILLDPIRRSRNGETMANDGDSCASERNASDKKSKATFTTGDVRSNLSVSDQTPPSHEAIGEKKDSVTNRVAGFICRDVLIGHTNAVTALTVVKKESLYPDTNYLLSSGWDRRILIWNLETGSLVDRFRNTSRRFPVVNDEDDEEEYIDPREELACDGVILDMEYCEKRNEFAYASSDGMVYIREFNPRGCDMVLRNTLQGHDLELTVIRWNDIYDKWITGSEDGTIKIWAEDGMTCERTLSTDGPVCTLCIDKVNGNIVAAVEKIIKVYDMENSNLVQTNIGHTENIRSVVHVVERAQYVTGSWDHTIRIWNAYKRPIRRRKKSENSVSDMLA